MEKSLKMNESTKTTAPDPLNAVPIRIAAWEEYISCNSPSFVFKASLCDGIVLLVKV